MIVTITSAVISTIVNGSGTNVMPREREQSAHSFEWTKCQDNLS